MTPTALPLPALVRRHAQTSPRTVAMRYKRLGIWQQYTWADVYGMVEPLAAWLQTLDDLGPCVAISGHNEPALFWAEYAVQATGRAAVCLYPELAEAEIRQILDQTRPTTVFAEDQEQCDKLLDLIGGTSVRRIVYWDARGLTKYADGQLLSMETCLERGRQALAADPGVVDRGLDAVTLEDTAVVIYTSGTTAAAKGVVGSHRYLIDCALRWDGVLKTTTGGDYVSYISPAWATEQYLGLTLGALKPLTVNFVEEPDTVSRDLREIGAHYVFFSPRQWEALVSSIDLRMRDAIRPVRAFVNWALRVMRDSAGGSLWRPDRALAWFGVCRPIRDRLAMAKVRGAVNSGGALGRDVFELLDSLRIPVHNVYGFTEVGIVTATGSDGRYDTVGQPLTSALGEQPLEIRVHEHEIQVRGGVPFGGYFVDDGGESKVTADGWIRSGDAGYFTDDGYLVYLDRLENVVVLPDGEVLAPQFVETRLRLSPFVAEVVVVKDGDGALHAIVDVDEDGVRSWAEHQGLTLGSYQQLSQDPRVIQLIGEEIEAVNAVAPPRSRVVRYANLPKALDADDGELTRSRKVKRAVVLQRYAGLVDALGTDRPAVDVMVTVHLADGRTRELGGNVAITTAGGAPRTLAAAGTGGAP